MFRPLSLLIGLRYIRAKKKNQFISIISAISFIGIALGVAVLITVLSVMNGFDKQIKSRILVMVPPVQVYQMGDKLSNWHKLGQDLSKKDKLISGYAPLVTGQGLLSSRSGSSAFVQIQGINYKYESSIVPIKKHIIKGSLSSLIDGKYNIVLGKTLAENLGVTVGDKITLVVPKANLTPAGIMPRLRQFVVSGIFSVSYQYDSYYAFTDVNDASRVFELGNNNVSSLQLSVKNIYQAPILKSKLNNKILSPNYFARDWTDENNSFFKALQMEKVMMFLILMLIVAVAVFNLLSSLVMVVTDKKRDIAILRTMGMSSKQIIGVFIVQGLTIGIIGTFIGVTAGIILSINATDIVNFIQNVFGVHFISASVYQIDFIPSQLRFTDVLHVTIISIVLSFIATLYPAWSASKVQPVEALRYE